MDILLDIIIEKMYFLVTMYNFITIYLIFMINPIDTIHLKHICSMYFNRVYKSLTFLQSFVLTVRNDL